MKCHFIHLLSTFSVLASPDDVTMNIYGNIENQSIIVNSGLTNETLQQFKEELLKEIQNMAAGHQTTSSNSGNVRHRCKIINRRFNEHIYPAIGLDYDADRRQVFSWIPGGCDSQCLWNLERNGARFKIKSSHFEEYLYAGGDGYKVDDYRRRVFTWKPKTTCEAQCYWDIQEVTQAGTTEKYYTIRNVDYGEYFYAMDGGVYDKDRRKVLTWKFDPNHDVQNDRQSQWIINCEN